MIMTKLACVNIWFSRVFGGATFLRSKLLTATEQRVIKRCFLNACVVSNSYGDSRVNRLFTLNSPSRMPNRGCSGSSNSGGNSGNLDNPPDCPKCDGKYAYYDGGSLFICPDCSHEWNAVELGGDAAGSESMNRADSDTSGCVVDCHGNLLNDGDDVILTKDLKVKGAQKTLKKGYKMRKIKVRDGGAGHDVECEGILLKSIFLKKA